MMVSRRLAAALAVVCLLFGLAPLAYAQTPVLPNQLAAGKNGSANAPLPVMPMGIIYGNNATATGTTGTGEETLVTWNMPVGTMDIVGRRLRITAIFGHAANTNSCTPKLYFGSEALATAAGTTSGVGARIVLNVLRTAANTYNVDGWGIGGTAGITPVTYSAPAVTEADSAVITIKATQTGGTTGADCTVTNLTVEEPN